MLWPVQVEEDTHRDVVKRILASETFRKAPKQRELLSFLADRSIEHPEEVIHEPEIGRRVFQRSADYNPAEDSIVRVEIRNLRKRLQEYFQTQGKHEHTLIEVPKGFYRLEFTSRANGFRNWRVALGSVLLVLLIGNAFLLWQYGSLRAAARAPDAGNRYHPILSALFSADRDTYIVLADSSWALSQDLLNRTSGLSDYVNSNSIPEDLPAVWRPLRPALERITSRQFTSLADAQILARMMQTPGVKGQRTFIRLARSMHTRDFKESNVILLGSARSNPWVELFEGPLNFRLEYETATGAPLVRNRARVADEAESYRAGSGRAHVAYAVVSLVDNLSKSGKVLMIAGTGLEATEAAGEFILNRETAERLTSELNLHREGMSRNFEILLRSSVVDGTPRKAEVIARRVHNQ